MACACLPGNAKEKGASVSFAQKVFDFGTLKDRTSPVSHEFEFTSDGDSNLVIVDATSECGCTRPEYPKAPLPPGKTGRVKVTFNPAGFQGPFTKSVTVKTNGKPRKTRLVIKGYVPPAK